MGTLDDYLTDQYLTDQQELVRLERTIEDASTTLVRAFVKAEGWPYRLKLGSEAAPEERPPPKLSHSTTAMVTLSLMKLLGEWRVWNYRPTPQYPPPKIQIRNEMSDVVDEAFELLVTSMTSQKKTGTSSGTYGQNDPLTLFFLSSMFAGHDSITWNRIYEYLNQRTGEFLWAARSGALDNHHRFFRSLRKGHEVVSNSLIPLRIVQAIRFNTERSHEYHAELRTYLPEFRHYFETTLHDHLSFSSIPDSRFDPAELTFCLEGLLLAQFTAVDRSLFRRVIDVLSSAQRESAFWRPTKPFMATQRGMSLFPVSVEVANSLLRACEMFDGRTLHDTFGSASIELFRRYWQWLRARTVTFPYRDRNAVGWHSEHVNQQDVIHIWETSQVLEFLLAFHRLLQAHIARTSLVRSRFNAKDPPVAADSPPWANVTTEKEPVTHLGRHYEIYGRIGEEFVSGWLGRGKPKNYSMLLYGPPGTGKTTVARTLASALGFRLITITVSDFLAEGGGQIESRAKAIFDAIRAQSESVILFDEIDHFLLDRDTKRYAEQETVFQFMTPGMLTKFADLHDSERVIFIIGTNYENRIDPAIKRAGRIDKTYLVLPPDKKARHRKLDELFTKGIKKSELKPSAAQLDAMANNSVFLSFKELEVTVGESGGITSRNEKTVYYEDITRRLLTSPRTTRLSNYNNRLNAPSNVEKEPIEEFMCLLALALEAGVPEFLDQHACVAARKAIGGAKRVTDLKRGIVERVPYLDGAIVSNVSKHLAKV